MSVAMLSLAALASLGKPSASFTGSACAAAAPITHRWRRMRSKSSVLQRERANHSASKPLSFWFSPAWM
jgi:hypothetical protein